MRGIMKYYKIWLPIISVVVFVGLAEMICRSFSLAEKFDTDFKFYVHNVDVDTEQEFMAEDPSLMWFPKPNYSFKLIKTNSRGFRDKERTVKKDSNVFRILCLGDSSTFGLYVPRDKTYHALLEERLNREFGRAGTKFEVINAGVTGYTSYQGLRLYKQKGYLYEPDIVTSYFGVNDHKKDFFLSDKQIIPDNVISSIKADMEKNLLMKLDSYKILRKFIIKLSFKYRENTGETVLRVSPEDYRKNILELNILCRKNGSELLLISPPVNKKREDGLNHYSRMAVLLEELEDISKKYNIPLIKIPEMTEGPSVASFYIDSVHPNISGHEIIMERLYHYLVNNKLLPGNRK